MKQGVGAFVSRVRHLRGHGIHSPFVYAVVRAAFVGRGFAEGDRVLYDDLRKRGIGAATARQVHNLSVHCGGVTVVMPRGEADISRGDETFVLLRPYNKICTGRLVIDTRRMAVIFPEARLPHETFRIW